MTGPLKPLADRRSRLLAHNAGTWVGQFVRLDANGIEQNRFDTHLLVTDLDGLIEASLTNRDSGEVRRMAFGEPPADMQISREGHWSLGPDRVGPWPWVSELCLVHGEQRRRAVVRLGSDQLESLVIVWEGRPQQADPAPAAPLRAMARAAAPVGLAAAGEQGQTIWTIAAGLEIVIPDRRHPGSAQALALRWQPQPGLQLEIQRAYDPYGNLLGPGVAGGADWPGSTAP
ncbi:MAG: hypothetical protein WCH37_11870 [Synechococcaceae cyanobacterium ELA182]